MIILSFGLGDSISVNAIIGLPTFKTWGLILDLSCDRASSKLLNVDFDLNFQHTAIDLPAGVYFDAGDFIRPIQLTKTGTMLSTHVATSAVQTCSTPEIKNNIIVNIMDEADLEPTVSGVVPA